MHDWRPDAAATRSRRVTRLLVVPFALGAASLVALLDASRTYLANAAFGRPTPWIDGLATAAPSWLIVGALAPLPLLLVRRAPIDRRRWRAAIGLHLAGALAFSAAHVLGLSLYICWQKSDFSGFGGVAGKTSSLFIVDLLLYAAIAGGAHALRFYREARARELAASQLQASLTEARLAALRGQLNPHFLFNTLNAISTMALDGQMERVVRTLGYLGDLLRVSLDDERPQEVTLDEELAALEHYLDIQRTRLGDRLTVRQEVDPATRSAMVPSMILQPLIENAITHGIARTPGPGTIGVQATRENGTLRIDVTDTGPGFRAGAPGDAIGRRPGIGLANTRARLAQLYGDRHGLRISAPDGHGACVSLTLPFRVAGPPENDRA